MVCDEEVILSIRYASTLRFAYYVASREDYAIKRR